MIFKSLSKGRSGKKSKSQSETPFEARRRMLAEEESRLRTATEQHQKFIESAPKIAAEKAQAQREVFLRNAARGNRDVGMGAVKLPDSRHLHNEAAPVSQRVRRSDQQKGKLLFFFLLLMLCVAAWWAWLTLSRTAF
jgi:hypothetical protein